MSTVEVTRDLETELAAAGDERSRVELLCRRAEATSRDGDIEEALRLIERAEALAGKLGDTAALGRCASTHAACDYLHSDYLTAHRRSLEASGAAEHVGDRKGVASALLLAAACQYQMGALDEAEDTLVAILDGLAELPDDEIEFRAANMLGMVLKSRNDLAEAAEQFERAIAAGARMANDFYLQRAFTNQASLFLEFAKLLRAQDRDDEASKRLEMGAANCESIRAGRYGSIGRENAAGCAGVLGQVYLEMGRADEALALFREMNEHGIAMENAVLQSEALLHIGRHMTKQKAGSEAVGLLGRSLELARDAKARRLVGEVCGALAAAHEDLGDLRAALEWSRHGHRVTEELYRGELASASQARRVWSAYQRTVREMRSYRELVESLMRDNEELSKRSAGLIRAALEDPLTGLGNRRSIDRNLSDLMKTLTAAGKRLVLAMVDIDRFKLINDRFSHSVGDDVLRVVAGMIRKHCRDVDVSARFGGDEFVLCLIDTPLENAQSVLERLREAVAEHNWTSMQAALAVTVSVGLTQMRSGEDLTQLLERADAAMYRAKTAGRNQVCVG